MEMQSLSHWHVLSCPLQAQDSGQNSQPKLNKSSWRLNSTLRHTSYSLRSAQYVLPVLQLYSSGGTRGRTIRTFVIGLPWFAWFGLCKPMANQIDQNPKHFVMRTSRIQTNSLTSKPIYLNRKPACKPILCHPN